MTRIQDKKIKMPAATALRAIAGGLVLPALIMLAPGGAIAQDSLSLKRITLSSGGVGYFEYETPVDGNAQVSLPVRLDQVDDVLKSLVIRDSQGVAATLQLAGREPLDQIFRSLPIDQNSLSSPAQLLTALQGSQVKVTGGRTIEGRLVSVVAETTKLGDGRLGQTTRHRVTLQTADGLQHFLLEDTQSIQFTDPKIREAVQKGLAAIEENRARDKRTLQIQSSGAGKRTLSAGYVVRVPVWKTTYRVTLPALSDSGTARIRLEGWAVLENMSAEDWTNVELTLVSGNPVTFRQSLYPAYYVNRPEVPVAVTGRLLPRPDGGAVEARMSSAQEKQDSGMRYRSPPRQAVGRTSRPAAAAADMMRKSSNAAISPAPVPRLNAVAQDAATQIAFRLPRPISVKTGHSLSVRFLNRELSAGRIALYQPGTHARHPLASIRIKNDGKSGLPPGALTFYENGANGALTYVGDAQLKTLPVGESRILSYALDNSITMDRQTSNRQSILKGKISNGLLEVTRLSRRITRYRVKLSKPEDRRLIIEHPRLAGWKLTEPPQSRVSLTPRHYRIPHQVTGSGDDSLEVVVERPLLRRYQLTSLRLSDAVTYAGTDGFTPPMREAFETLAALKRDIDRKQKALTRLEAERKRWANDQARIRENLSKVPRNSDLHRSYLQRLSAHEKKIETVMSNLDGARADLDKAKEALSTFIQNLKL